ncbi:MAG: hypothetical protein EOO80_06755 [Oxalobacteraceae bacterium]|nr:MAG: hypothetical protein EOO80_06755 [Oxalobacteraceae bacterium]
MRAHLQRTSLAISPVRLRIVLARLLAGAKEASQGRWRKLLGFIGQLDLALHPRSNLRLEPAGTSDDRYAIELAPEVVRQAQPYVRW